MIVTDTICYTKYLWLAQDVAFMKSVRDMRIIGAPDFQSFSMAGYIETKVEFSVVDVKTFAERYTCDKDLQVQLKQLGGINACC